MALALSLVTLGLLFFGQQWGLPFTGYLEWHSAKPAVHATSTASRSKAPVKHAAARPAAPVHFQSAHNVKEPAGKNGREAELPFEEHLSTDTVRESSLSGSYSVRGKVTPPPPVMESSAGTPLADRPPMIALVIDDLGDHPQFAKALTELPFPVTMAILPNRPHTRTEAAWAAEHGLNVILHQPMQPISYPRVNPGPGAVFTDMDAQRVERQVSENLEQLPNAVGMNNHMGSAFTADAPGMAAVMSVLKARGLFFLDSVTSPKSAAPAAARQAGVPLYRRSVFLDNVRNVRAILGQLKVTERAALKNGRAIAIGHPYPETLAALKLWAKEHDGRIHLVTISELGPER